MNRRTGRTAIMLKDTIDAVVEGKDAVLIGANSQQCEYMVGQFLDLLSMHEPNLVVHRRTRLELIVDGHSVRFMPRGMADRDLRGMHGIHVEADHYAWEDMQVPDRASELADRLMFARETGKPAGVPWWKRLWRAVQPR